MKKLILSVSVLLMCTAFASAEIFVGDPSFEDHNPPPGGDQPMQLPWERLDGGGFVAADGDAGIWNVPDGTNACHPSIYEVYQDLSATYENGQTYTLSAMAAGWEGT